MNDTIPRKDIFIIFVAIALAFPIGLEFHFPLPFPLSTTDIALQFLFFACLSEMKIDGVFRTLILSAAIALCGVMVMALLVSHTERGIYSWSFFFKVYVGYLLGYWLVESEAKLRLFMKVSTAIFAITLFLSYLSTPMSALRDGLFVGGIYVAGTEGVNGFAVFDALLAFMLFSLALDAGGWKKIGYLSLGIFLSSLPVLVASRQAILGIGIFAVIVSLKYPRKFGLPFAAIMSILGVYFLLQGNAFSSLSESMLWFKWSDTFHSLAHSNVNSATAGRFDIYKATFAEFLNYPVFGKGFSGYSTSLTHIGEITSLTGSSPHNQYLGALWKMGIIGFLFYAKFLLQVFQGFLNYERNGFSGGRGLLIAAIVSYLVFMMAQDFLTYPLTGYLFMFIAGAVQRIMREDAKSAIMLPASLQPCAS